MRVTINGRVTIEEPTDNIFKASTKILKLPNPQYFKNINLGVSNFGTKKDFYYYYWNPDLKTLQVPIGFWVEHFYQIKPDIDERMKVHSEMIKNATFNGELRDYQQRALDKITKYTNGILESPTGSGKTVIALALIKALEQKTLFLVHTIDLAEQFMDACEFFLGFRPGLIGSGKYEIRDISVGILKTITTMDDWKFKEINKNFGMTIADEVHIVGADTIFRATAQLHTHYKFGLSATPERADGKTKVIKFATGPIRHAIHFREIMDMLCFPRFEYEPTEFDFPLFSSREMHFMMAYLMEDEKRNAIIVNARNRYPEKKCAILCKNIEHMNILQKLIPGSRIINSKTPKKLRSKTLQDYKDGIYDTIISSYKILGTGIDDKNIDLIVMAGPTSSKNDVKQSIGRTMRPRKNKEAVIIDLVDSKVGMLDGMAKSRKKYYKLYIKMYEEKGQLI